MSRWDRPKPPKDWRYWVGGLGRVLITVGLLMFAFVAYQLWGTGIQTARAQDRLDRQFERAVEANRAAATTTAATTPPPGATTPSSPATFPVGTVPPGGFGFGLDTPPASGDAFARLRIPRLGADFDWTVVQGVDRPQLQEGPGHFPSSVLPGEYGNLAIAGHRTTYGAPFGDLDQLQPGDDIYLTDLTGQLYHYRATEQVVVLPTDYALLVPTLDPSKATITLITCDPKFQTSHRLAVRGDLVLDDSPPPRQPTFHIPDGPVDVSALPSEDTGPSARPPATVPASVPVAVPGTPSPSPGVTSASAAVPAATSPVTSRVTSPAGSAPATTGTSPGSPTTGGGGPAERDALSAGWFSDPTAWPQVALWGAALVGWCLACYVLARSLRRVWVGLVVGAAPFVVLLYFWFENINRLLPPGL